MPFIRKFDSIRQARPHRKFIAVVAGAACIVAAISAAPVRAGETDAARAFATLFGLAVLGAVIHDIQKDQDIASTSIRRSHVGRAPVRPALPQIVRPRGLPHACLRVLQTSYGPINGFAARCLRKRYAQTFQLPRACVVGFEARDGIARGFAVRCLRHKGYILARR